MHNRKFSSPYSAIYLEMSQKVTPEKEKYFTEGKILTFEILGSVKSA